MASIQASSTATTGMTVDSSKNGAYVDEATMSGASLSTMLTNVFPSAPAHTDSVPAGSPAFKNTSNALRALSTPGASRLITTYFITSHLPGLRAAQVIAQVATLRLHPLGSGVNDSVLSGA